MSRPRKSRIAYVVKAQHRVGLRWQTIERGQQPQRFAVYREERSVSRAGHLIRSHKLVAEFTNATLANEDALRRTRLVNGGGATSAAPTTRTLGGRFGPIGKVIAGSSESPWAKQAMKQQPRSERKP